MLREKRLPSDWDAELYFSHACLHPAAEQASTHLRDSDGNLRYPRHPYPGDRPRWSGFCVWPGCHCECHEWNRAHEVDIPEFNIDNITDMEEN